MTSDKLHLELHLTVDNESTNAVELLRAASNLSASQIKQAMKKGAVWLSRENQTRRIRRFKKNLQNKDELHFYYDSDILSSQPQQPTLIADYKTYSLWNKPYGVYCQGSKWGDHCTINRLVEQQIERPSFIVHRLDRATNGLIIIAHSKQATARLANMFAQREVEKRYTAIVHGQFPPDENIITIDTPIEGKEATSHIQLKDFKRSSNQSLVDVHIETGRKHQIRRHLSEAGHAIVGDRLYGQPPANGYTEDLQLCCYSLSFICPMTKEAIDIKLPETLQLNLE
jgi:tRNA pseudouridine32 synthase/23S rRNA pseudouridine746 synthase